MKDLILAIAGPKYCDWCNWKEPSWADRLFRLDQLKVEHNWYERLYMRWMKFNTNTLKIWELGRKWHFRFHPETI